MAASAALQPAASSIVVPDQLTLRTIHGRNGPFNVGRLVTPIGKFAVKDAELEQYPEGKYDGEFIIRYIDSKAYPTCDGMRFEIRASLDGMTLSGIDKLSKAEARAFATQEIDPLDEELAAHPLTPVATSEAESVPVPEGHLQSPAGQPGQRRHQSQAHGWPRHPPLADPLVQPSS